MLILSCFAAKQLRVILQPAYRQSITTNKQALAHLLLFLALGKDEFNNKLSPSIQKLFDDYRLLKGINMEAEAAVFNSYRKTDDIESFEFIKHLTKVMKTRIPATILKMATEVAYTANNYTNVEWIPLWEHLAPFLEFSDIDSHKIIMEAKAEVDAKRVEEIA